MAVSTICFSGFLGFNQFCGGILWHFVGIIEFGDPFLGGSMIKVDTNQWWFSRISRISQCLGGIIL